MVEGRAGAEFSIFRLQIHSFFFHLHFPYLSCLETIDFSLESRFKIIWPKEGTVMVEIQAL